jgi:hypothetical protein
VALLDALAAFEMAPERTCAKAIASVLLDSMRRSEGLPPPTTGLEGLAVTLRSKHRRVGNRARKIPDDPRDHLNNLNEVTWRSTMASAFTLVIGARDPTTAKAAILERAKTVGEGEFAQRVMFAMVDAKFGASPEFPTNIVSTHEAD